MLATRGSSRCRATSGCPERGPISLVLAIIYPIAAFVALGFEHSIANMYFIPIGNVVGGGLLVAAMYWFVYLRPRPDVAGGSPPRG